MSTGVVIGVVIGVLIFLALVGVAAFYLFNRLRTYKLLEDLKNEEQSNYQPPPLQFTPVAATTNVLPDSMTAGQAVDALIDDLATYNNQGRASVAPTGPSSREVRFDDFYSALQNVPRSRAPTRRQSMAPALALRTLNTAGTATATSSGTVATKTPTGTGTATPGGTPTGTPTGNGSGAKAQEANTTSNTPGHSTAGPMGREDWPAQPQPQPSPVQPKLEPQVLDSMDRIRAWAAEEFLRQKLYLEYIVDEVEVIEDENVGLEFLRIVKKLKSAMLVIEAEHPEAFAGVTYPVQPGPGGTRLLSCQLVLDWQARSLLLQLTAFRAYLDAARLPAQLAPRIRSLREFGRAMDS